MPIDNDNDCSRCFAIETRWREDFVAIYSRLARAVVWCTGKTFATSLKLSVHRIRSIFCVYFSLSILHEYVCLCLFVCFFFVCLFIRLTLYLHASHKLRIVCYILYFFSSFTTNNFLIYERILPYCFAFAFQMHSESIIWRSNNMNLHILWSVWIIVTSSHTNTRALVQTRASEMNELVTPFAHIKCRVKCLLYANFYDQPNRTKKREV